MKNNLSIKRASKTAAFIFASISALTMCSCRKAPEPEPVHETVAIEIDDSIRNPMELTKEELLALTAPEIKEMVEAHLPNYRYVYKIDDDYIMTDNDWLSLRDVICISLYGSLKTETEEPELEPELIYGEIDADNPEDPDWIYYAPTTEYIEGLDEEGFIQYMNGLFEYEFKTGTLSVPEGEDMPEIDFHELSAEELASLKEEMLKELKLIK